jgi:hypothetical protein
VRCCGGVSFNWLAFVALDHGQSTGVAASPADTEVGFDISDNPLEFPLRSHPVIEGLLLQNGWPIRPNNRFDSRAVLPLIQCVIWASAASGNISRCT